MENIATNCCLNATHNNSLNSNLDTSSQRSKHIVQTLIFFLALFLGTVGNALVLAVEKSRRKKKRNSNDIFIINLAISDLLFLFSSTPDNLFRIMDASPNSALYCHIVRPFITMTFCVSIFTISTMAVHRCKVIVNPFKRKMKNRYALLCVAAIWVVAFIATLPGILVAKVIKGGFCGGVWLSKEHKRLYILAMLLLKFIIPLCIIAMAYLRMGLYVIQSRQRMPKPKSTRRKSTSLNTRNKRENCQIVKTLAVMIALFAVCTGPHQIAWMLRLYGGKKEHDIAYIIYAFSPSLNYFHSCVNPIIFGALTRKFRRGYLRYIAKLCCCFRSFSHCTKAIDDNSTIVDEKTKNVLRKTRLQAQENITLKGPYSNQLVKTIQTSQDPALRRTSKVCFEDISSSDRRHTPNATSNRAIYGGLKVRDDNNTMSSQEDLLPTEDRLYPENNNENTEPTFSWQVNYNTADNSNNGDVARFVCYNSGLEVEEQPEEVSTFDTRV